jgi:two-component system response regulator AtoC
LAPAALAVLARYDWPGNVRELKNTMEYVACVAMAQPEEVVEPWHLPERITAPRAAAPASPLADPEPEAEPPEPSPERPKRGRRPLVEELRMLERERMVQALKTSGGVKVRAAELLKMPLRTFTFKCKQYGL